LKGIERGYLEEKLWKSCGKAVEKLCGRLVVRWNFGISVLLTFRYFFLFSYLVQKKGNIYIYNFDKRLTQIAGVPPFDRNTPIRSHTRLSRLRPVAPLRLRLLVLPSREALNGHCGRGTPGGGACSDFLPVWRGSLRTAATTATGEASHLLGFYLRRQRPD
jgi:hypothetical protein